MRQLKTTNYRNCTNWLRRSWRVLFLLAIANCQLSIVNSVKAQDENAAFYIYQNDGHFDGFFYDEVKKISYSVIDTLGIEHDEIVSQEIVTADSTYRIMLSAIDSVSFVQPEIRFNPKSHDVRKENMLTYLISKDEEAMTLTFSSTMPDAMRPKVGDVLYDFDLDEGFSFRVKSISVQGGNIVVVCEDIESIHDIFEQFITVEEYGADDAGSVKSRRVAGCPELNVGYHARKQQEINFNLFNFSLSGHLPIYAGNDATATIDLNIASAADLKAVWNFPSTYARIVDGKKDYVGITLTLNNELSAGLTFDGKIADVFPAGLGEFGKLPLPAAAPIFVVNFGPDGMVRGEVHAKYSFSTPKFKGKVWFMLEFNDWSPSINFGHGTPPGEPEPEPEKPGDNPWGASFEFSGFMQGGMQFPLKLYTNKLLESILKCEVGTTVYLGPKLSGAISVDLLADNTYDLFKDSKLSLSYFCADYETKAKMKAFWGSDEEVTLADGSFSLLSDIEVYLFPEFEVEAKGEDADFDYSNYGRDDFLDATSGYLKATIKPSRNILWPLSVGIGVFEGEKMIYSDYAPSKYSQFSKGWKAQDSWTKNNLLLKAGPYTVRPLIEIGGHDIKASPAQKIIVPGAYLRATADINYPQATQITAWYDEAGNPKNTVTIESSCDIVEWLSTNADHPPVEGYTLVPAGDGIWNVKCDLPVNYNLWETGGRNTLRLYGTYYDKNGKTIYIGRPLHVIQDRNRTFAPDKGFECILGTPWANRELNNSSFASS